LSYGNLEKQEIEVSHLYRADETGLKTSQKGSSHFLPFVRKNWP
jgi:hypothetical protein